MKIKDEGQEYEKYVYQPVNCQVKVLAGNEVVKISLLLGVMGRKKISTFKAQDPLSPANLFHGNQISANRYEQYKIAHNFGVDLFSQAMKIDQRSKSGDCYGNKEAAPFEKPSFSAQSTQQAGMARVIFGEQDNATYEYDNYEMQDYIKSVNSLQHVVLVLNSDQDEQFSYKKCPN